MGEPVEKESVREVKSYKDLDVFQRAMNLAMNIFDSTKKFPKEEQYSLTDQCRRSSRSICANIGEAWRKRRYQAAFISKLSDAETEACETQVWIQIARRCEFLTEQHTLQLEEECERIIAQLVCMISQPQKWSFKL